MTSMQDHSCSMLPTQRHRTVTAWNARKKMMEGYDNVRCMYNPRQTLKYQLPGLSTSPGEEAMAYCTMHTIFI